MASKWGLLVRIFFLAEGFCGETFLFYGVIVSVGGSVGNVSLPPPYSSHPPCPSNSSPPPLGESDPLSLEAFSSSSVSISLTSSYFFFFFIPLDYPTSSTWVKMGLLMVSVSKSSALATVPGNPTTTPL
jgi:hypothetical protein